MAAANAGLGLLLETTAAQQRKQHQLRPPAAAQITSKATTLLATNTAKSDVVKGTSASFSRPSSPRTPPLTTSASCSFLQRCFFCHRELTEGRDIYIYRGERAFCSEECRCRHILAEDDDDDDDCASVGVVVGGFTF